MQEETLGSCKASAVFKVKNDRGLHTRPATEIVKCAARFKSNIRLIHKKVEVNAKSILGVLMLAASKGTRIKIEAIGIDAEEAVASLIALANNQFDIDY
ncbi:MAG: HPr family phosphocarrier protein [Waddliaceae bacterium]